MMLNVLCKKQSVVVDQQVVNKENVPQEVRSNMTTQRPTKTSRVLAINQRSHWSNESLEIVMDAVECGITSLLGTNKFWGIPVISFSHHLNGKTTSRIIGPMGVLIEEEDEVVVAWVLSM